MLPRFRSRAPGTGLVSALLVLLLLPARPSLTAPVTASHGSEPNLYERIAAGSLVVHGRFVLGGRRASVDVLEVLKGTYAAPRLQVSYRSENINRSPGSPKISFQNGDDSILVLEPEKDDLDRLKGPDRFMIAGGPLGKIDLSAEGAPALLDAARRIAAIQKLRDQKEIWDAERALIQDSNPHVVSVGFAQVLKFRLGNESLVTPLIAHLGGPRPEFRQAALRVLGQIFEKQRRTGQALPSAEVLAQEALMRATGDESPETRAEAVRALRELRRRDLVDPLRRLAASDPSQIVRYEAELALQDLKDPATPPP